MYIYRPMLSMHFELSSRRLHGAALVPPTLLVALLVSTSGCMTGPDAQQLKTADAGDAIPATFKPPELSNAEIAADPTAATAARLEEPLNLDQWWSRFHDDALDALIARADSSNATLAQALSSVRISQASLGVTESELWPDIYAGAGYQRVQQNLSQLNIPGISADPYNEYSYGLSMPSWELDIWGRIERLVESSTADLHATIDDLRMAITSIRAQTATAYIEVRTLQARIAALDGNITNLTQTLKLATQKFDAGTVTQLDVNQAQTNLDMESAKIPSLRSSIADAIGQLAELCGSNSGEITVILGAARPIPIGPDAIAVGIPASLLERRGDLRAAAERYHAAVAQIGATEALNYPTLSLAGNFSISSTDISGLGNISNKSYGFGPSLSLPLFTGWQISSQILMAKAGAEYAFNSWRGTLIRAVSEVDTSIAALAFARDTDGRYLKAVASASDTYRLAKSQYDAGTTALENLLSIQNQLLDAQDSEAQARGLVASSIVQLYRVLGGGWEDLVPAGKNDENSTAKAAIQEADSAVEKSPARLAAESPLVKTAAKSTESGSNK